MEEDPDQQPSTKKIKLNDGSSATPSTIRVDDNEKKPTLPPTSKNAASDSLLTESQVGITAWMNPDMPGFKGILKHRYTDFLVNEIDMDGRVMHLTSLKAPSSVSEKDQDEPAKAARDDGKLLEDLGALVSAQDVELVKTMLQAGKGVSEGVTLQPESDKAKRTKIHRVFSTYLSGIVSTNTVGVDEIRVEWGTSNRDNRGRGSSNKRKKLSWDELGGSFCHFLMFKENRETVQALESISKMAKIQSKKMTFAGTKDKRGITVQRVAAQFVNAETLAGLNKTLRGIQLGDFQHKQHGLKLGSLQGNQFELVLREASGTREDIEKTLNALKASGFINYYGMQRFGTQSVSTHSIGVKLLKSDWQGAVDLVLMPRESDSPDILKARQTWKDTQSPREALKLFPKWNTAERAILEAFNSRKSNKDCAGAMANIPRHLRQMYVHAYQSYVWNRVVSARIQKLGRAVVLGDLVSVPSSTTTSTSADGIILPATSTTEEETDIQVIPEDEVFEPTARPDTIKTINTEVEASQYQITDIVIPQPGYDVKYPPNMLDTYKEIMNEDGLDPLNMKRSIYDYSLPGSYRKMVGAVKDFEWRIVQYSHADASLTLTDLDRLKGLKDLKIESGDKMAVILKFCLDSSTYATMALREVLKTSTTPSFQAGLSSA
ncbi:hypothetical protein SmJEL517_g01223 [Synchytrium microbalum]|uniref:TRUD domain-containing protein n=1 Tax=Synchytrium microbalum TaxID=1806994 RepID=A0A507CB59_9FUNG|nr:uncharacterized protein SmJEL517_g01223 [Synchytrium microbalum]TPX36701.1 hypothetical protein SmJEL517_g01223 [Synchytrium microbalum]